MSTIFVCVGQCGNQLAKHLFDYIDQNETQQTLYLHKHFDGKYRSINVDSEIKVINSLNSAYNTKLRPQNLINTKCGRGSNWASGYTGLSKDGALSLIENSMEAIRKEAERCDFLMNFHMLHSLSGGTGSGFGSRLIESIRDVYGCKKYLFTCSVAPFKNGELPLQHYNNLLCMSNLHDFCDLIQLFRNDDVLNLIERIHAKSELFQYTDNKAKSSNEQTTPAPVNISINDINSYIVACLYSTMYPVDGVSVKKQSIGMETFELQRLLASNNNTKIVELYNFSEKSKLNFVNRIKSSQNQFIKDIFSFVKTRISGTKNEDLSNRSYYSTINSLIILRGNEFSDQLNTFQKAENELKKLLHCVQWNPYTVDYWTSKKSLFTSNSNARQSATPKSEQSSLTIALNRDYCVDYLEEIKQKSLMKYKAKAYLHWYTKFNIDHDYFEHAFENINTIIDSYCQMTT